MDGTSFEGIHDLADELKRWSWVYGHSPKFFLNHSITLPAHSESVEVCIEVDKGVLKGVEVVAGGCNRLVSMAADRLKGTKLYEVRVDGDDDDDDNDVARVEKAILRRVASLS